MLRLLATAAALALGLSATAARATDYTSYTIYDAARRVVWVIGPDTSTTGTPNRIASHNTYDIDGRMIQIDKGTTTAADGSAFTALQTTKIAYDLLDRKVEVMVLDGTATPALTLTQYSYDVVGRPRCTAVRMNPSVYATLAYGAPSYLDPCILGPQGINGPDLITQNVYNNAGQLTSVIRAVGTALQQTYAQYTYTPNGLKASEQDVRNNTINLRYDGFDRVLRTTYPDNSFEENTQYDPVGNILTLTTRANLQLKWTYDGLNRKLTEQGWNPVTGHNYYNDYWRAIRTSTFGYDVRGHLTSVSNDTWNVGWAYDGFNRLTGHTQSWLGTTIINTYDGAGNPTLITHPDKYQEGFVYDSMNRMTIAKLNGTPVATLVYDSLERRKAVNFADGSVQSYGYDNADRLTSQIHTFPNTPGSNVTFGFGYDPADRLTSEKSNNSSFVYSPPTTTTAYGVANALNQYPTAGPDSFSYLNNVSGVLSDGSLTQVRTTTAPGVTVWRGYYFDEKRQFASACSASTCSTARVDYLDANGERYETSHNWPDGSQDGVYFTSDGARPEASADVAYSRAPGGSWVRIGWRDYVLGPDSDERLAFSDTNGTIYYPHTDRQGSTIALSSAGYDVLTRTYGPYGEPGQTVNQMPPGASSYAWLYTGQHYDAFSGFSYDPLNLGLYYYKARIYDSGLGRFLQPDPIGTVDDLNLYAYTHNDPLDHEDPSGNDALSVIGGIIFTAGEDAGAAVVGGFTAVAAPIVVGVGAFLAPSPLADGTLHGVTVSEARAKDRSADKRRTGREAQRGAKPSVPTSRPGKNTQNAPGEPRGQIKEGSDGKPAGVADGSKDRSNGPDHPPGMEAGRLKPGEPTGRYGQPRLENEGKCKVPFSC